MLSFIVQILVDFVLFVINKIGYAGIFFLMVLESANIPVPSEAIMPFSGFLVEKQIFSFWLVVLAGAFGNLIGSLISYGLADKIVESGFLNKHRIFKFFLNSRDLEIAKRWFDRYGKSSIFFSRMLPVVRTFISFPAGLAKMNLWEFSYLTFLGSFIWSVVLTYSGIILGERWGSVRIYLEKFDYLILAVVFITFSYWVYSRFLKNYRKEL
ncbi:MAG: DedA family protein [Candidatus Wolfebacteria bacterium]|nr:DedA family protein [Candidatus Wolfebacteria bacterium]